MKSLFDQTSYQSAVITTQNYSTSFSSSVRLLDSTIRQPIYNIYGFVRLADEIVDSFEGYPQTEMLDRFENEYYYAVKNGISSNLIINAFQGTLKEFDIDLDLVEAFLKSMRADLHKQVYTTQKDIADYIYGSADVVGLMCLKVFVNGNKQEYEKLKPSAMKLGSAFQKINFLRDLRQDLDELNRSYFPILQAEEIDEESKKEIIRDIQSNFNEAYEGIVNLPKRARLGVYVAYRYYKYLLKTIDKTPVNLIKQKRIRVSNSQKGLILFTSYLLCKLNICRR